MLPGPVSKLVFVSDPVPVEPGEPSGSIDVQTQDKFGNPSSFVEEVVIEFSSSSPTGRFDVSPGGGFTEIIVAIPFPPGTETATAFYLDTVLGDPVISARENPSQGWQAAQRTQVVALTLSINILGRVSVAEVDEAALTIKNSLVAASPDERIVLTFSALTRTTSADGERVKAINVADAENVEPPPDEHQHVGQPVDLTPDGTIISPPVQISISYPGEMFTEEELAELTLAFWDGTQWVSVPSEVDKDSNTVKAELEHFSVYSLIAPLDSGSIFTDRTGLVIGGALVALALVSVLGLLLLGSGKLVFLAVPTTVPLGTPSDGIQVDLRNRMSKGPMGNSKVNIQILTDSPGGSFDMDASGAFDGSLGSIEIVDGSGIATFYYRSETPGMQRISVSITRGRFLSFLHLPSITSHTIIEVV